MACGLIGIGRELSSASRAVNAYLALAFQRDDPATGLTNLLRVLDEITGASVVCPTLNVSCYDLRSCLVSQELPQVVVAL